MSLPLGTVYDRNSLWPNLQRDLERQQLNDLDVEDQAKYVEYLRAQETINQSGGDVARALKLSVLIGDSGLNHKDLNGIVDRGALLLSDNVVNRYMDIICEHVNSIRRRMVPHSWPGFQNDEEVAEKSSPGYTSIPPIQTDNSVQPEFPSCGFIKSELFTQCTSVARATEILEALDLAGENFKNLDYLLIPFSNTVHHALLGFAPRQKFVFIIDSVGTEGGNLISLNDRFPKALLMRVLFSQVDETETWPLYTQWPLRSKDTFDGSPNVVRQKDFYNCGVFTVMNAMCLAFGYDMLCFGPEDLDPLKRPRMLMELLQGSLGGKYAYDLLDVPNGPLYMNPIRIPQFARYSGEVKEKQGLFDTPETIKSVYVFEDLTANVGGDGAPLAEAPEISSGSFVIPITDDDDMDIDLSDGKADDLDEAFGIIDPRDWMCDSGVSSPGTSSAILYPSPPPSEIDELDGRSSMLRGLILSVEKAIKDDFLSRLSDMHEAWDTGKEYVRESEIERRLFPPQLDQKYFQKQGFLYGSKTKSRSEEDLSGLTSKEHKPAYELLNDEDTDEWLHESPDIVHRWTQNKTLAFAAKYWGEIVDPSEWLLSGYEKWHEKHSRKENDAHSFLIESWKTELQPDFKARRDVLYQFEFIRERMKEAGTKWSDVR
ncbi:hypothetical protein VTL71DRAFT_6242 [Oculimacula yallundae]|uniref:Ubiquitin-like protease family profile domain-containing protein n=1 Tax=Oculimacula yallundae TaxID=86028 RepID=A0ABR4BZY5_9HELO